MIIHFIHWLTQHWLTRHGFSDFCRLSRRTEKLWLMINGDNSLWLNLICAASFSSKSSSLSHKTLCRKIFFARHGKKKNENKRKFTCAAPFSLIKALKLHISDVFSALMPPSPPTVACATNYFTIYQRLLAKGKGRLGWKRAETTPTKLIFAALLSRIFNKLQDENRSTTERFFLFFSCSQLKSRKKKWNWFCSQVNSASFSLPTRTC